MPSTSRHDPYAAFRHRTFRLYIAGSVLAQIGGGAQSVAIGWEMYQRTGQPIALGLTGLVQALPMLFLTLPAGYLADRFHRTHLLMLSLLGTAVTSIGLALLSYSGGSVLVMYALLLANAVAGTLGRPARAALLPQIVPRAVFENAIAWRTSTGQIAGIAGPALGGIIAAFSIPFAYLASAATGIAFIAMLAGLRIREDHVRAIETPLREIIQGIRYVWHTRVLLLALALDLFAVLLGGAVYLLPIYAKDILFVGEHGLGWLRAAPAAGALCTALYLAHRPAMKHAGRNMLLAVAVFGAATIVFGVSRSFWLSLAMLFLTGAADNVSVVVRQTMTQLLTPNRLRGRVSAVSAIFIGSSNELGGFESGLVAQYFGPVVSVVSGGLGSLLVVAAMAIGSPRLRRFGAMHEAAPAEDAA
ncbi:MFS transporter [bacterium]|nr:MFS transporter [bacterium]